MQAVTTHHLGHLTSPKNTSLVPVVVLGSPGVAWVLHKGAWTAEGRKSNEGPQRMHKQTGTHFHDQGRSNVTLCEPCIPTRTKHHHAKRAQPRDRAPPWETSTTVQTEDHRRNPENNHNPKQQPRPARVSGAKHLGCKQRM
jgi:hypothetical protein